jgi:hypothetical protein
MNLEKWLEQTNLELREKRIEHKRRPWEAIGMYSRQFGVSVSLSSQIADQIFKWFEANSRPDAQSAGSLFESTYFYDAAFWVVSIPIVYGSVKMNALDSLSNMPIKIKSDLERDSKSVWNYLIYWADCIDYGMGIEDLRSSSGLDEFGRQLLLSGDAELRSAASLLLTKKSNTRAILVCRMAVELFLKSYIAATRGLSKKEAKSINHDLERAFDIFIEITGFSHLGQIRSKLSVFPPFDARYEDRQVSLQELWDGFALAQSAGVTLVRRFTDRNTASKILGRT